MHSSVQKRKARISSGFWLVVLSIQSGISWFHLGS